MRVVHLVTQDNGGAGRACVRLHKALLESRIDSIIITQNKTTDTPHIQQLAQTKYQKLTAKIRPHLQQLPLMCYRNRVKDIFSPHIRPFTPSNPLLTSTIKKLQPDIVHLHWIEGGFFNIKDLESIHTPMLWSLHDANPYTGGCHIVAAACVGVSTHCRKCPLLRSKSPFDISYWTFRRKAKTYARIKNLTINGLSRWIASNAKDSALLGNKSIINIPNPIDTDIYRPFPKHIARQILRIHTAKILIGFGAIGGASVARKGFSELKNALESLPSSLKAQCELLIFGGTAPEIKGITSHTLGFLHDEQTLALAFNACDVFVSPSLAENLSNTIMESLSCGTPVVAFDIGGNSDMITHKHNGYLALHTPDLAQGIEWICNLSKPDYTALSQSARESALRFDSAFVARQYINAYKHIIFYGGGG